MPISHWQSQIWHQDPVPGTFSLDLLWPPPAPPLSPLYPSHSVQASDRSLGSLLSKCVPVSVALIRLQILSLASVLTECFFGRINWQDGPGLPLQRGREAERQRASGPTAPDLEALEVVRWQLPGVRPVLPREHVCLLCSSWKPESCQKQEKMRILWQVS